MYRLILSALLLFSSINMNAQDSCVNKGNLKIYNGASLSGFGSFINTSTAILQNDGSFYVKKNINNDQAAMTAGAGTLYFNGTSSQSLNGTQAFKTYNLVTNNSAGITLNNDLSVAGVHTFTSGLILSSATPNYLIYEAGSSYSGDGDTRHVNGWVKKSGSTNFTFPVGDASYERPVGITNLSVTAEMNCKYFRSTPNRYNLTPPIIDLDSNEYWQINKISGGTAQVALNWVTAKVPFYNVLLGEITSSYYNGSTWVSQGGTATGAALVSGNVTSNAVSSFGKFGFGYKSFPIPLKLISFAVDRSSGTSFINWTTENEQEVDHFEVQRSDNGPAYRILGTAAARNTLSQQQYHMEDHSAINGIAYYRLRSVDIDGKFSYSKVVALTDRAECQVGFIVLNPVHSEIIIFNKTGRDGSFDYRLLNAGGQLLQRGNIFMTGNGGTVLPLPSTVTQGIYILEISRDDLFFRQKIIVEK